MFEARQDASSNALSMVSSQAVRLLTQEILISLGHSLQSLALFIPNLIRKAVTFLAYPFDNSPGKWLFELCPVS